MKSFFLSFLIFLSINTVFAKLGTWSTIGSKHPLWEALNVKVIDVDHDFLRVQRKEVGQIRCEKTELPSDKAIQPSKLQYHCKFPKNISSKQALALFKSLKTKAISTNGAYTEIKIVDKLIVIGDTYPDKKYNSSRAFLNHPCESVNSKPDATACMKFWGKKVLPSFEEENVTYVVKASNQKKSLAKKTMRWGGYSESSLEKVDSSQYIGMMAEFQDEQHFYYFSLNNGKNVVPSEIMDFNTADIYYSKLEEMAQAAGTGELDKLIDDILEAFFLGTSPERFPYITEDIRDSITDLNED